MKKKDLIFLIGMPGAGKSHWLRNLGGIEELFTVDTDALIEGQTRKSIMQIFEEDGEQSFRDLETATLKQFIRDSSLPTVICCGGGMPCHNDNLELMKQHGWVVYLKASLMTLQLRCYDNDKRPLLNKDGKMDSSKLRDLYFERTPVFELADFVLPAETCTLEDFEKIIQECFGPLY